MSNALSLLGLCRKAGRLELGEAPALLAVKNRLCRVLLIAGDAADGTARRARFLAQACDTPVISFPADKRTLGALFSRESVALAAVTDDGLAAALLRSLEAQGCGPYSEWIAALDARKNRKPKKTNRRTRR